MDATTRRSHRPGRTATRSTRFVLCARRWWATRWRASSWTLP